MEVSVKEHTRKRSRVRRHTRSVDTKEDKARKSALSKIGSGEDFLRKAFISFHPDHSGRKLKIHHTKSGKITATYKYRSGNVAHFTYDNGWKFNYEN